MGGARRSHGNVSRILIYSSISIDAMSSLGGFLGGGGGGVVVEGWIQAREI